MDRLAINTVYKNINAITSSKERVVINTNRESTENTNF